MVSGKIQLIKSDWKVRTSLFKNIRRTSDVRQEQRHLSKVIADKKQLDHIREKRGKMEEYFRKHKDALENSGGTVEAALDEIRFKIIDLQNLKHAVLGIYKGDEDLERKGIPPKIAMELKTADKHTQEQINGILQDVAKMFGDVTRESNI